MEILRQFSDHPLHGLNVPVTVMRDDGTLGPLYRAMLCGTLGDNIAIMTGAEDAVFDRGESLVIQAHLRDQAIGFSVSVVAASDFPKPHYYLEFPLEFVELNLRKSTRVPTLIPVSIGLSEGLTVEGEPDFTSEGALINLSRTGCALSANRELRENETLQISLSLPGEPGEYRFDITVVNRLPGDDVPIHGARFNGDPAKDETLQKLAQWLNKQKPYSPSLHAGNRI